MSSIDLLPADLIKTEVECATWQDVVREAGTLLINKGLVDPDFIDKMIGVVDQFGPYMILLPKVCLFHGPPGQGVHKACLSLVTLKNPVYFTEYDNEEITCGLAFGAVDTDGHLAMLQKVSLLLQDDDFVELITNHGSKEEILAKIASIDE